MSKDKNQGYQIDKILNSPDKGIMETRGIGGIVARLWRQILKDMNIRPAIFHILLAEFVINTRKKMPDDRVSKLFTRGNVRKELERPTMTFKVFMKGIKMLNVVKFTIAVELQYASGKTSKHSTSVDLGDPNANSDLFEEDKKEDE